LTAGTIFHKSKIPLHKWFWLIFLMANTKKGVSALNAQKLLGVRSYKSIWLMLHKVRWAMDQRDQHYYLQGTVETDESYYGGVRHGTHGRGTSRTPVFIAAENRRGKPGYAKMKVLPSVKAKDIGDALQVIAKGSTLKTDGLNSYKELPEKGFVHDRTVLKSKSRGIKVLPWVHMLASNSKRFLLGTHHSVSKKYLGRYLSEFSYRFNRRHWHGQIFERLLYACLTAAPAGRAAICT
jgi:transposase-like protein